MTENMRGSSAKDGKSSMEDVAEIYQKVLEDLMQVNSLFKTAVFLGISFASVRQQSFCQRKDCDADRSIAKRFIVFEVIAFGCYLLSSLVSKALKMSGLGCLFLTLSMVNIIRIRLGKMCEGYYTFVAAGSFIAIVSLVLLAYIVCMMRTMVLFFLLKLE